MKKQNTDEMPPADEAIAAAGGELEMLRAEIEEPKLAIRRAEVHRQITGELTAAGARSPELLLTAIADAELETAAKDAAAYVAKLRGKYPEQFAGTGGNIDGGSGRNDATLTREMLAAMSTQEIAELNWDEVSACLSA
jgi:hypothetical protein